MGADALVVGDVNIDYLRWTSPDQLHNFMTGETRNRIKPLGFAQLVTGPMRCWRRTRPSLTDQSWSNNTDMIVQCNNISRPVMDHNLIQTIIKLKYSPRSNCEIIKRSFKYFDKTGFQNRVKEIDWQKINSINYVNLAYNFLEENLNAALSEHAPIIKVEPGRNRKSWVTDNSRKLIMERDKLKQTACAMDNEDDWSAYRKYRNLVNTKIRKDRKLFLENLYNRADTVRDTRALYRITKENLGWKLDSPPTSLVNDGKLITKPVEMEESLSKQRKNYQT